MFWQRERKKLRVSMVVLPFFAAAALSVCFAGYENGLHPTHSESR
jgi:hypothetical protein